MGVVNLSQNSLTRISSTRRFSVRTIIFCVAVCVLPFVTSKMLTASYSSKVARTHVEIDGVDYGFFTTVEGINNPLAENNNQLSYRKISLNRDFVTDPSLYLWARNTMKERTGLKNIHLVTENREGKELARYILKDCQPLSWTVEAANPALGGFHEIVDIAVQDITVY